MAEENGTGDQKMGQIESPDTQNHDTKITLEEFLLNTLPHEHVVISNCLLQLGRIYEFIMPKLKLYCPVCEEDTNFYGESSFKLKRSIFLPRTEPSETGFFTYTCQICRQDKSIQLYAINYTMSDKSCYLGTAFKIGEYQSNPIIADKYIVAIRQLKKLMGGSNYPMFRKALIAENLRLGIGAATYYRRLVDDLKDRLLDVLATVAKLTPGLVELEKAINQAKNEKSFTRALTIVKDHIPSRLIIEGKNPLQILYNALSVNIHEKSDKECLQISHDIKHILYEMAKRLDEIKQEHKGLIDSLNNLSKHTEK